MLISGGPFHLFKFGYLLKKEFGIKWVADYRDDWNTNEVVKDNLFKVFIQAISKRSEVRWAGTSEFFISVSDYYVDKINKLLRNVRGYTILNGYIKDNYVGLRKLPSHSFTIVYVGSLYPNQSLELFISAYKKFLDQFPEVKSKVIFVGLKGQPGQMENVRKQAIGYEDYFEYTLRVPKKEAIEIQYNASILLVTAYKDMKGIPGSKLYEYIILKKPVLVCPSDGEIIETTLKETGQGYFANTEQECFDLLCQLYKEYGQGFSEAKNINLAAVRKYDRFENTKKLVTLLEHYREGSREK